MKEENVKQGVGGKKRKFIPILVSAYKQNIHIALQTG